MLSEIKVYISRPEYRKYFADDKEYRNVYRVTITRGSRKISFNFGDSINNTQRGKKPRLYDILTTVGMEYFNPDKMTQKLRKMFDEDEAMSMPR